MRLEERLLREVPLLSAERESLLASVQRSAEEMSDLARQSIGDT